MKIIITESKLNQMIIDYLNETYDTNNIGWTYGIDDWGNEVDYAIEFYEGDYEEGDSTIFRWYGEDYWTSDEGETISSGWGDEDDETINQKKLQSPLLVFENTDDLTILNGYFGDKWKRPFIDWFWDNFHVPVKTIE
jgi:hypothetical protein